MVRLGGKPRASGDDPGIGIGAGGGRRVNPARAGMIRPQKWQYWVRRRKPRASGDDPPAEVAVLGVKSLGVVFFRSGGDGGQGGATVDAVGAVVGLEHVGQAAQ